MQLAAAAAKKAGLDHFVLATKNETSVTIHFEDVSIKNAMEIIIAGFHNILQMDVEKHPEYTKQTKQVYTDLQKEFDAAIRKFNKKRS